MSANPSLSLPALTVANSFPGIELKGVQGLQNKLRALVPNTRRAVREAVALTALLTESDAKLFAPVDTGRLRASIHTNISENGLRAEVVAQTDYAIFLETGTRRQRAQPFLEPALNKNRAAFLARLKAAGLK